MVKGDKAPFNGVLITDGLLAKIKTDHEKEIKLLNLEVERLTRKNAVESKAADAVCTARIQAEQSKADACNRDRERQREIYTKAIESKKCPNPIWHYISFVGGAVVAGGICVAADRGLQ